jgi:TATA-binding protein-associated factor Taf7
VNVRIRSEDNGLYAISIVRIEVPITMPVMKSTEAVGSTEVIDGAEHLDIDSNEAINPSNSESDQTSSELGHDEVQGTAVGAGVEEHESSSSEETPENHESENHGDEGTPSPEQHVTP